MREDREMNRVLLELKKLHKLIIHNHKQVGDDKVWYHLARKETRQIAKLSNKDCSLVCMKCFG